MNIIPEGLYKRAEKEVLTAFMFKLQRRILNIKKQQTLSFTMCESYFLETKLRKIMSMHRIYEQILITKLLNTIHQQTL